MNNEYKESKIGLAFSFVLIAAFILFPYYMWYKTSQIVDKKNKEYIELKNQVDYVNKLLSTIEDLTIKNQELAKSENEYISKYCGAINFSTNECKDFIIEIQKAKVRAEEKLEEDMPSPFGNTSPAKTKQNNGWAF